MMKKNGFTLAEVLITLAIIGVIATMTLPSLITNTSEQQAKSGFKKIVNTLSEAAQMNEALAGFDFGTVVTPTKDLDKVDAEEEQTIYALLRTRTQIDYKMTGTGDNALPPATPTANKNYAGETAPSTYVHFKDGTVLMFDITTASSNDAQMTDEDDGMVVGFLATVDTNGAKGPNVLSNCATEFASRTGDDDSSVDVSNCSSKDKRYIADRFQIRIRGSRIEPVGAAASWALQN